MNCIGPLSAHEMTVMSGTLSTMRLKMFLNADGCSPEARAQGEKIIDALGNGSWVSWFPLVKYPTAKAVQYKRDYPKLTNLLKNKLLKIQYNTKIIDAVHYARGAPKEVITEALQWGKGPEIVIEQLGGEGDDEIMGKYKGILKPEFLNTLFLDIDLVNKLESSSDTDEISDALAFLITVTLLHEYSHLGDNLFQDQFWHWEFLASGEKVDEAGYIFEDEAFGEYVYLDNFEAVNKRIGGLWGN